MDSSVLLAGIGVVGTLLGALSGAIVGAWLNPLMQDWRNRRQLKQFINKCNQLEKFVLLTAYRTAFLSINNIKISNFNEFNTEDMFILNNLTSFCEGLGLIIQKFKEERKIFAALTENEYNRGYTIALYSNISNFINDDKQIRDNLIKETKEFIANKIYPHYRLMLRDSIFNKIDKTIIRRYMFFMHHIGVFNLHNKDLSHLNLKIQNRI